MSLNTFVIVVGALVALFVFGLAGSACGGLSSGTGIVDSVAALIPAPHLEAKDLIATPACLDVTNNRLRIPANGMCTYDLKDEVGFNRRMLVNNPQPANVLIVVQQDGLTFKSKDGKLNAFIERKRSKVIHKKPSRFTVTCVLAQCTLPLS